MAAKLLYTVKQFLGDNRLLHIRNDLLLLYGIIEALMHLVANGGSDEIHGAITISDFI